MRTKKAIYNALTAIIMQLVSFGAGLIIPRLIIASYGSDVNGLVVSVVNFIEYLYLIEVGISGALTFSLYKPLVENDRIGINRILAASRRTYNQIGLYASGLVVAMMFVYPFFVVNEQITYWEVFALVAAVGSASLLNYFTIAKYMALLIASQSNYVISLFRIVYLTANVLIIVTLVHMKFHFAVVYGAALLAQVLQAVGLVTYVRRKYDYIRFDAEPDMGALSNRNNVLVHELANMAVFSSPIILLTLFATLTDVSIYAVYALVFTGISRLIMVFNNGFTAGFGQLFTQKEKRQNLQTSYSQYEALFYMLLTFVYSSAWVLGIPFIQVYTHGISTTNYVDPVIWMLFVAVGVLDNWRFPQASLINAAGHFKQTRHRAIIEAGIMLVTATALVFPLGVKGVLIGLILALGYRSIDIYYAHKLIGMPFGPTLGRIVRMLATGAIIVLPFETVISIQATGMWSWVVNAVCVALWAGAVSLLVNFIAERQAIVGVIARVRSVF